MESQSMRCQISAILRLWSWCLPLCAHVSRAIVYSRDKEFSLPLRETRSLMVCIPPQVRRLDKGGKWLVENVARIQHFWREFGRDRLGDKICLILNLIGRNCILILRDLSPPGRAFVVTVKNAVFCNNLQCSWKSECVSTSEGRS